VTARRVELTAGFISFVLGLIWIVLLAHDFRIVAEDGNAFGVQLTPPMGWAGVTLYCIGSAAAICGVALGACLQISGARLLELRLLLLSTGVLAFAVLFYALAPEQFWSPQAITDLQDQWFVVLSVLALAFAATATTAGLVDARVGFRQVIATRSVDAARESGIRPGGAAPDTAP